MRPNNQNKRSRGRGGGRKHTNPLSRNFESNGPDVKIRGNASHIAEKYVQLARDAQASGDSVMAENYLQHAEHYFRIVSAAQAQMAPRNDQPSYDADSSDEDDGDETDTTASADNETESAKPEPARANGEDSDAEEAPRKSRERRPRRRRTSEEASDNPAKSPQPEVGELPAFLTNSQTTAAE